MADAPRKHRWSNPEEDASFAAAFLKGCEEAKPIEPLTADEKQRLADLILYAVNKGDDEGAKRLQSLATNPLGLRELFKQFPDSAADAPGS